MKIFHNRQDALEVSFSCGESFLMTLLHGHFSVYIQYKVMIFCRWGLRDQEKKHQEARRREILVLIHHHLVEEGLKEAADILGTQ